MRKPFHGYRAVIFDVDGTLYYQWPLRLRMAGRMACYYLCRPSRLKEALAVKTFRQVREHWEEGKGRGKNAGKDRGKPLDLAQYEETARRMGKSPAWVKNAVERWMYRAPLEELPKCLDKRLKRLIRGLHQDHKTVIIYSDYPAAEKLEALGIQADYIFTALDEGIMCLKPDPKGMGHILHKTGFSPDEVLMVGDRYSRDGLSAASQGVDYLILPAFPWSRKKCYKNLAGSEREGNG